MRVHEFRAEMKRFCISGLGAKRRGQCLPRSKSPSRVTTLSRSETGLWKLSALVNRAPSGNARGQPSKNNW